MLDFLIPTYSINVYLKISIKLPIIILLYIFDL